MFGVKPLNVSVVPVPVIVEPPGVAVTVQVPDAGSPLKATLPVAVVQVGWVMAPTIGAVGISFTVTVVGVLVAEQAPSDTVTV